MLNFESHWIGEIFKQQLDLAIKGECGIRKGRSLSMSPRFPDQEAKLLVKPPDEIGSTGQAGLGESSNKSEVLWDI